MKKFIHSISLTLLLAVSFLLCSALSCEKDDNDDNNSQGSMWNPDWMIGTWEGTTPAGITPFINTKIRIVFETFTMVEHDTLQQGERKAYAYAGTFTWDVDGLSEWSMQFKSLNYPVPDFNIILWDCILTPGGQTMNNISLRIGDETQTDPFHNINLDCGPVIDYTGDVPETIDFYGDAEIETNGNFEEALYPPQEGTMIRMTKK